MKKPFSYLLLINLLILNSVVVFLYLNRQKVITPPPQSTDYKSYVDQQIDNIKQTLVATSSSPSITPTPTSTSSPAKSIVSSKTSVSYIPIPGSGQTLNNQWTDLHGTEFYLNKNDFPGLKQAYFEANFKLFNGNGKAYLRLFDITNGIEIWGSQIETSSQLDTMISSSQITLRKDNSLIRVQAKSLTADTTIFNSGRLKLVIGD